MIGLLVLKLILAFLSGLSNSVMDLLSQKHSTSIFKKQLVGFWADAHDVSWRNKYKLGDPRYGRKKFLGVVIPVFLLDGWHFSKMIMLLSGAMALALPSDFIGWWWNPLFCGIAYWMGFESGYNHLFLRK